MSEKFRKPEKMKIPSSRIINTGYTTFGEYRSLKNQTQPIKLAEGKDIPLRGTIMRVVSLKKTEEFYGPLGRRRSLVDKLKPYITVLGPYDRTGVEAVCHYHNGTEHLFLHLDDLEKADIGDKTVQEATHELVQTFEKTIQEKFDAAIKPIKEGFETEPPSYEDINYLKKQESVVLNLGNCYMSTGVTTKDNGFMEYRFCIGDEIVDVLLNEIENGSYVVYIPTDWTNFNKHNQQSVKDWIEMLNSIESDIPLEYTGIVSLKQHEPYPTMTKMVHLYLNDSIRDNDFTFDYALLNNKYHRIILHGCESGALNHFIFSLLTSLYKQPEIAGLSMQIKKALGERVTNLQAILMSLISETKHNFYNTGTSSTRYIPDVFASENSINYLMDRIATIGSMYKGFWVKSIDRNGYDELLTLLAEQDFETFFLKIKP